MRKVLVNYGGVILLYMVIFFGIIGITRSISGMESNKHMVINNK